MKPVCNRLVLLLVGVSLLTSTGCVTLDLDSARTLARWTSFGGGEAGVDVRKTPSNPLHERLNLLGWGGPKPTERTEQTLRRYDVFATYEDDAQAALLELHRRQEIDGNLELLHALAELSYIEARQNLKSNDGEAAKDMFGSTMAYAYRYLFAPEYNRNRNVYDPEFRRVSDLYNGALEDLLRQLKKEGNLRPGYMASVNAIGKRLDFTIAIKGPWHADEFEKFEFVSDYEVTGLNNTYQTFGLGVPLIAVRRHHENEAPEEKYYPKGLTFSVTAFFRVLMPENTYDQTGAASEFCAVELHDPLSETSLNFGKTEVPLESDITTPMAYYLNDPLVSSRTVATLSLLNAEFGKNFRGLYMLEPYDPNRIPVVMVHGLWSSPVTWMEMFNDLRGLPEIRENYQFWFYMYPTGQPFWISAEQMREDLAEVQTTFDPQGQSATMNQMVLVGHSMGGLVSRLQTMYSEDDFWRLMTDQPFEDLQGDSLTREQLRRVWFFEPNPSIRRVVTIGTPHRGSEFANPTTRWLSHKLFRLPKFITTNSKRVVRDNPRYFEDTELLSINTSVDSLSPKSPIIPVMMQAEVAPWVNYHNIVGVSPSQSMLANMGVTKPKEGDGVVSLASATMDNWNSQIEVPSTHTKIHQHPRTILEVRRILLEHLAQVHHDRTWDPSIRQANAELDNDHTLGSKQIDSAGITTDPTTAPPITTAPETSPSDQTQNAEPSGPANQTQPKIENAPDQTSSVTAPSDVSQESSAAQAAPTEPALSAPEDKIENEAPKSPSPTDEEPADDPTQELVVPILTGDNLPQRTGQGIKLGADEAAASETDSDVVESQSPVQPPDGVMPTTLIDLHDNKPLTESTPAPTNQVEAIPNSDSGNNAERIEGEPLVESQSAQPSERPYQDASGYLSDSPSPESLQMDTAEMKPKYRYRTPVGRLGLSPVFREPEPPQSGKEISHRAIEFQTSLDWSFPELELPNSPSSPINSLGIPLPASSWFFGTLNSDSQPSNATTSSNISTPRQLNSSSTGNAPPIGLSAFSVNGF